MEAVAILHSRGFGRLKLLSYFKEGIGAWRHCLFASDNFPSGLYETPEPKALGSLPNPPLAIGSTAEQVADNIALKYPDICDAATGQDENYVNWYRTILKEYPGELLIMESRDTAAITTSAETDSTFQKNIATY
jgi:hypothetical protein